MPLGYLLDLSPDLAWYLAVDVGDPHGLPLDPDVHASTLERSVQERADRILVSVAKRFDRAVEFAVRSFLDGKLEGRSLEIAIEREAVGIVGVSAEVPPAIRRKVAKLAQRRREEWASWATS